MFFRLNDKLMLSHLRSKLLVGVHVVVHYIDNRRLKEFLYSLCDNGTDIVLLLHFGSHFLEQIVIIGKLEVPVYNVLHNGSFTCQCALGVDKVDRIVLMTQIALICIALFGLAALNGALADDLPAVEEHSSLFVIELSGGYLFQMTHLIKLSDKSIGDLVVPLCGVAQSGSTEQVKADVIIIESFLLSVVISLNIVTDSSCEALFSAGFSVALGDRGAVAVCSRNEDNVLLAYPVTQEACIYIGKTNTPPT